MADDDQEEILKKKGPELFRELKRVYPGANVEDYFAMGAWKDDVMAVDWQLVSAHRREAGAEEPPALEDVPMPAVPKPTVLAKAKAGVLAGGLSRPMGLGPTSAPLLGAKLLEAARAKAKALAAARLAQAGAKAGALSKLARPDGFSGPKAVGTVGLAAKPNGIAKAKAATPTTALSGTSGPVQELRQIALFLAKWRLDPTRTKMMLAKLGPIRRRYVIQNFKPGGGQPTDSLQQYIAQCEKSNAWPGAASGAKAAVSKPTAVPKALSGTKRPWTPSSATVSTASKFPRLMTTAPKASYLTTPSRSGPLPKATSLPGRGAVAAARVALPKAVGMTARAKGAAMKVAQPKAVGSVSSVLATRRAAAAGPAAGVQGTLAERIAAVRARAAAAQAAAAGRPTAGLRLGAAAARPGTVGSRPLVYGGMLRTGPGAKAPAPTSRAMPGSRATGVVTSGWGSGGRPATSSLLGGPRPKAFGGPIMPGAPFQGLRRY